MWPVLAWHFFAVANKNDALEALINIGLAIAMGFAARLHYKNGE